MPSTVPNPGSREALVAGCSCPVMDNNNGRGFPYFEDDGTETTVFYQNEFCTLHGTKAAQDGKRLVSNDNVKGDARIQD
jgi:hypothetical protein